MKLRALVLPSSAAALAAFLCTAGSRAFVTSGYSLPLSERDVRVFDNFSDSTAHLNTTPDFRWPGYTGPYLALWKACVEWGSEKHFEGHGDPHQPGDLGSGGANFDPSWQGAATGVGQPEENIMSEIGGNGAGVLAYCETPGTGWRIRFYKAPWLWFDLPENDTSGANQADLQGVATHEYGHALGLAHSNNSQATMYATLTANEVIYRSIENDDVLGVQSIYGVRLPTKPLITGYDVAGATLTLRGENFSGLGNTVWWTQSGSASDGTPIMISGVASQANGTEIVVTVPATAGPGDVLVQRAGTAYADLSNAFPFHPQADPCPEPVIYGTAKLSSVASLPSIGWSGTPSTLTNDFRLTLTAGLSNGRGLLFYGNSPAAVPFHGGWMLSGPRRFRVKKFTCDSFGFVSLALDVTPALAGLTRYYQFWYEDLGDPWGSGTSDAIKVTFCD